MSGWPSAAACSSGTVTDSEHALNPADDGARRRAIIGIFRMGLPNVPR
jgi:hypothetical protein